MPSPKSPYQFRAAMARYEATKVQLPSIKESLLKLADEWDRLAEALAAAEPQIQTRALKTSNSEQCAQAAHSGSEEVVSASERDANDP